MQMEGHIQKRRKEKIVLGSVEKIRIRDKIYDAKVDTGAERSCVCKEIAEELELGPPLKKVKVKNVYGETERPVIKEPIKLKGKKMNSTFSVYDRSEMNFPVLIGKNIIRRGFIVDLTKDKETNKIK